MNAAASKVSKKKSPPKKTAPKKTAQKTVYAWIDDPGAGAEPTGGTRIQRAAPTLGSTSLGLSVSNPATAPAVKLYAAGTAGFRYWTAAEALRRGADFWGSIVPGARWQPGATLPVDLDHGVDLNAFYDRVGLRFFHDTAGSRTVYSGESADVATHELGHAVLDSIKPALWDAMSMEIGSFHESFGDMSALLSALQLPQLRADVLSETGGSIARASRWSRLAEQLGWAIRLSSPDSVDPDCLRNAANSFSYRNPSALPRSAAASQLSREVHSFSRVFTGAALDCMAGMFKSRAAADSANLLQVSIDFATILVAGIKASPVATGFYAQVATHAVAAADQLYPGSGYAAALRAGFMKHSILTPAAVRSVAEASPKALAAVANPAGASDPDATLEAIDVADYPLGMKNVFVVTASDKPRFRSAAPAVASVESAESDPKDAAKAYLEDLISSGRLRMTTSATRGKSADDAATTKPAVAPPTTPWRVTHEIRAEGKKSVVRRMRVHCGLYQCLCGSQTVD
jgi:hypothetical protein